jgi:protein transport protein SEC61 subunit gamma-like protein
MEEDSESKPEETPSQETPEPKEEAPKEEVKEETKPEVKEEPKKEKHKKSEKEKKPGIVSKMKNRLKQYRRTIEVSRKPDKDEFTASSKITGLGILLLGAIGFILFLAYHIILIGLGLE